MRSLMIVDDEVPSRELIKMSLDWRAFGFATIHEARNGREALAVFEAQRPSLIITDIQMPVMTGWDLLNQMKSEEKLRDIPVIIITADDNSESEVKALNMGAMDV